jgi:hypothetical protein
MPKDISVNFKLSVTTAKFIRGGDPGTAFFGFHSDKF